LSPTAIAKWEQSVEDYYLYYLADHQPPREPQTQAMAIGSAFDAYVKSYLHDKLFGQGHRDSNRFGLKALFEAMVEPQHRNWAWINGAYVFGMYQQSGALLDLLSDLQGAQTDPRFEFEVTGTIDGYREGTSRSFLTKGLILLGKPDCAYINKSGRHVVLDWKVNGYCSKWPVSPMQGYIRVRGADGRSTGHHQKCSPFELDGITVNIAGKLEDFNKDWARQLSIYAWLLGELIGSDFIIAVDQIVCRPEGDAVPSIRIAEHRMQIGKDFQWKVFDRAVEIWEIVTSSPRHIFRNLTLEESKGRCQLLEKQAELLYGDVDDQTFVEMTRR
jgi:hypothetical protein